LEAIILNLRVVFIGADLEGHEVPKHLVTYLFKFREEVVG
jgi:hypothetical protein